MVVYAIRVKEKIVIVELTIKDALESALKVIGSLSNNTLCFNDLCRLYNGETIEGVCIVKMEV